MLVNFQHSIQTSWVLSSTECKSLLRIFIQEMVCQKAGIKAVDLIRNTEPGSTRFSRKWCAGKIIYILIIKRNNSSNFPFFFLVLFVREIIIFSVSLSSFGKTHGSFQELKKLWKWLAALVLGHLPGSIEQFDYELKIFSALQGIRGIAQVNYYA